MHLQDSGKSHMELVNGSVQNLPFGGNAQLKIKLAVKNMEIGCVDTQLAKVQRVESDQSNTLREEADLALVLALLSAPSGPFLGLYPNASSVNIGGQCPHCNVPDIMPVGFSPIRLLSLHVPPVCWNVSYQ